MKPRNDIETAESAAAKAREKEAYSQADIAPEGPMSRRERRKLAKINRQLAKVDRQIAEREGKQNGDT